ncbi:MULTISPECIES: hypothetical protein [unclassified Sphingomonas]|uniref:hypothetical protein n=1 Tax=unclassified Sphingomonas TaxID=196159 RepID=UPI00226AAE80|nr:MULTISPECIES: hypothetical protein [unclassified Sphingomonas]
MTERISTAEEGVVAELVRKGVDAAQARAGTLLATRGYARPFDDIVSTLQQYPGLHDAAVVGTALRALLREGLLSDSRTTLGHELVVPAANICERLATLATRPGLAGELLGLRERRDAYVEMVGPLADARAYETYVEALRTARNDIVMAVVNTDPETLQSVKVLEERAREGVRVRILGAGPKVIERLRGAAAVAEGEKRIEAWHRLSRRNRGIEYRLSDRVQDMLYATSVQIDGELLRLVVYDPFSVRSKEGQVLQLASSSGTRANVIRDFTARFDVAWRHARRPGPLGIALSRLGSGWQMILGFALLVLLALIVDPARGLGWVLGPRLQPTAFNVLASVAATLLVTGIATIRRRYVELRDITGSAR